MIPFVGCQVFDSQFEALGNCSDEQIDNRYVFLFFFLQKLIWQVSFGVSRKNKIIN